MRKLDQTLLVVTLTVVAAMMGAGIGFAQGATVFVELSRPQCDDLGHYMPVVQEGVTSIIGFASARGGVVSVRVNDTDAEVFPADYRPLNAPPDYAPVGFSVPLLLYPDTILAVTATGAAGDQATAVFRPDAEATFARLRELSQNNDRDAYYSLRLANAYCGEGDYDNAYMLYNRCISLQAGFDLGPFFYGLALFDNDRDDDAISQFGRCLQLNPGFYLGHYHMGRAYDRRGDYDHAISEYQWVIGRWPKFVSAHWRLGDAYSHRGDWDNAGNEYRAALRYNPNFAPAHHGLGAVLARQNNWDGAANELRTATKLSPWSARNRSDLAATLAHQQDWTEAAKQYRQAVRINPRAGDAHQGLAQSEFSAGRYSQAWDSVHKGQQAGTPPDPKFVEQLRQRMPEPKAKPVVNEPYVPPVDAGNLRSRGPVTKQPTGTTFRVPLTPTTKTPTGPTFTPPTGPTTNPNSRGTTTRTPARGNYTAPTGPTTNPPNGTTTRRSTGRTYTPPAGPTANPPTGTTTRTPTGRTFTAPTGPVSKTPTGPATKTLTGPGNKPTTGNAAGGQTGQNQKDKRNQNPPR